MLPQDPKNDGVGRTDLTTSLFDDRASMRVSWLDFIRYTDGKSLATASI
jgi:hypothetical protein